MNVNAQFALPTIVDNIEQMGRQESDPVLKSRFETVALLLRHIENKKMWNTILQERAVMKEVRLQTDISLHLYTGWNSNGRPVIEADTLDAAKKHAKFVRHNTTKRVYEVVTYNSGAVSLVEVKPVYFEEEK